MIVDDDKFRYMVLETRDCQTILGDAFDPNGDSYTHSDTSTKTWVRILTKDAPSYNTQPVSIYTYEQFMAEEVQALFRIDADYYLDRDLPIPGEPLI